MLLHYDQERISVCGLHHWMPPPPSSTATTETGFSPVASKALPVCLHVRLRRIKIMSFFRSSYFWIIKSVFRSSFWKLDFAHMQICKHEHSQSSSQDGLQNSQASSHIANCQASSSHLCIFFEVHNEAGINTHANCKHQKQPFMITQSLPTSQASHHLKIFAKQLHINIKRWFWDWFAWNYQLQKTQMHIWQLKSLIWHQCIVDEQEPINNKCQQHSRGEQAASRADSIVVASKTKDHKDSIAVAIKTKDCCSITCCDLNSWQANRHRSLWFMLFLYSKS